MADITPRFRVGRHHRDRTLYDGDTLIGCVDTGYGPLIINALNATQTHSGAPTRERLLKVIKDALLVAGATHIPEDWIAEPVLNLLADIELDTEGDLREQLAAHYEQLRAEDAALLERSQAAVMALLAESSSCPYVVVGEEGTQYCSLAEAPQPKVLTAFEDDIVSSAAIRITNEMDDADLVLMTGLLMIIDRLTEDTLNRADPHVTGDVSLYLQDANGTVYLAESAGCATPDNQLLPHPHTAQPGCTDVYRLVVEDTAPPVTQDPERCICGPRDDDPSDPDPDCPQHGHLVRPITEDPPPPTAEEKVSDLMAALEESVAEAVAERDRLLAARAEDTPGGSDGG